MDEMTPEEIRAACAPKSDQFNAEDLLGGGSATLTVKRVRKGSAEQPVEMAVEEDRRVYRPAKTMSRLLMTCWGGDATKWKGRRFRLYTDPTVKFGGVQVGGLRISHLSHIDGPKEVALTETRGKRRPYRVEPLPADAQPRTAPQAAAIDIAACTTAAEVAALIKAHSDATDAQKKEAAARWLELSAAELAARIEGAAEPQDVHDIMTEDGTKAVLRRLSGGAPWMKIEAAMSAHYDGAGEILRGYADKAKEERS